MWQTVFFTAPAAVIKPNLPFFSAVFKASRAALRATVDDSRTVKQSVAGARWVPLQLRETFWE